MSQALLEAHFTRCGRMNIGGWLALIGTVVAELSGRSEAAPVLACRITESSNRLNIPPLSAAPPSRSALGVIIFFGPSAGKMFRKWHKSAAGGEN
jgi:hypothetical protein